mgnify:CR=1 FL=1
MSAASQLLKQHLQQRQMLGKTHVALRPGSDAFPGARVTLVEPMGAHEVVWLDMQGQRLAAIAPATGEFQPGAVVGVQMDLDRASLFDRKSEDRLDLHASAFYHRPH